MSGLVFAKSATLQNAATATGNGTALDVKNFSGVSLQVTGISGDTLTFEATIDDSNWVALQAVNFNDGAAATTTTGNGLFHVPVVGLSQLRARISTYGAGTITVKARAVAETISPWR